MHYPEIKNQILADEVSLPNDTISHRQHTLIITEMVSSDLNEIFSLHSSDSYMLQNHEAGLNYIKMIKKTCEFAL